ncbi:MAG: hypothetical protein JNM94_08095 [Phycisphaerae bacterium]|nr:hypothetical protein [Phycisphaerae bacterium]
MRLPMSRALVSAFALLMMVVIVAPASAQPTPLCWNTRSFGCCSFDATCSPNTCPTYWGLSTRCEPIITLDQTVNLAYQAEVGGWSETDLWTQSLKECKYFQVYCQDNMDEIASSPCEWDSFLTVFTCVNDIPGGEQDCS